MVNSTLLKQIRCVISDVDGVMTSGQIVIDHDGHETKVFHVHDGFGIKLLMQHQIEFAVITSRESHALRHRLDSLGVKHVYQGQKNKQKAFEEILSKLNINADQVAYIGDDWPDLIIMNQVALPIAVANAVPEMKDKAKYITAAQGGEGAVREVAMLILKAQDKYQQALASYEEKQ